MAQSSAVAYPRVTFNIVNSDQKVGLETNRALLVLQKTAAGSAPVGLNTDIPRTSAELDALFGPTSMGAFIAKAWRRVNPWTIMDAIVFADAGSSTAAAASITFAGTATAAGSYLVSVASKSQHTFKVDVAVGDTAVVVAGKLAAQVALGGSMPFTTAQGINPNDNKVTFTAGSKGTHANGWPIIIEGAVAGLTATLTAWTGGATDPSLTGIFDPIANMRHQHIVWPSTWVRTGLKTFLDASKNVDNDIQEGRAFIWSSSDFATVLTEAQAMNSSEIVLMTNKSNNVATRWIGPHLPEAPDLLAANFCAARARRYEPQISISDIVATNESKDQFGGMDKCSLPYFNTPLLGVDLPLNGTGYSAAEQRELENAGVTVAGANRSFTGVVMGAVVTTWLDDVAGNPDDTWKYLEWRDTHGAIREYLVLNCRKRFAQYRLTGGVAVANYAMATKQMISGFILGLCVDLMDQALVQKGQQSRQFIQDNMVVDLDLNAREAAITLVVPMVSQLETMLGTVKYTFSLT